MSGQSVVVVVDPTKPAVETKLTADEQAIFNKALPAVRKHIPANVCESGDAGVEVTGVVHGSFSKVGARQTLVYYQYCQTGNGLGWVGLVLMEGGRVVGNFIADTGWTWDAGVLPDINQNGLDEFTLAYGGGSHGGIGGVGVDIMEFTGGKPKGIGWFKAQDLVDMEPKRVWKVTAKPGNVPVFYKQKYLAAGENKWRRSGGNQLFKLTKAVGTFEVVK